MALTPEEKAELRKKQQALTDEDFLAMDEVEFRARFRERVHHTLEIQTYYAAYRNQRLKENQADYAKRLVKVWEKRGLSRELGDYRFAVRLIELADKLARGEQVDLSEFAPEKVTPQMEQDFFTILYERRSVREYKDIEVPDELIKKVLNAGLWAAASGLY